ncbi:MAG: biotin-dependent carboxyltransferase family protein [Arenimonas sp.]
MIVFETAGISSLQDLGRRGLQNQGIGVCGAMDGLAARVANNLLGNADNTALIEITLGGTRLHIEQTQWFAITGADLQAEADGIAVDLCRPVMLEAGTMLHFKQPRQGCRAYLAVQGGFSAEPVLGSVATDIRSGIGGYHGRAFQRGDRIGYAACRHPGKTVRWHTAWANPAFPEEGPLPFIPGSHWSWLDENRQEQFCDTDWRISRHSDRMGLRLEQALHPETPWPSLLSSGVAFGSIQLPPDGHPIILAADRQTTGGYPLLGTVASIAHSRLAQCRPRDHLRFEPIAAPEAVRQWRRREGHYRQWRQHMAQWWHT